MRTASDAAGQVAKVSVLKSLHRGADMCWPGIQKPYNYRSSGWYSFEVQLMKSDSYVDAQGSLGACQGLLIGQTKPLYHSPAYIGHRDESPLLCSLVFGKYSIRICVWLLDILTKVAHVVTSVW
jgi:hypothetical protein